MNRKKIEKSIINSVDKDKVISVEDIKSRMDFSKKELIKSDDNKLMFSKKRLVFTSLMSSFATLIIVLVLGFVIRVGNEVPTVKDILVNEELNYIKENSMWINPEFVFCAQVFSFDKIYIIETNSKTDDYKTIYYYKYTSTDKTIDVEIVIGDEIIKVTQDDNFGVLLEGDKSNTNKIEFIVKGLEEEHYYCFTN